MSNFVMLFLSMSMRFSHGNDTVILPGGDVVVYVLFAVPSVAISVLVLGGESQMVAMKSALFV